MDKHSISPGQEHQNLKSYGSNSLIVGLGLVLLSIVGLLEAWINSFGATARVVILLAVLFSFVAVFFFCREAFASHYWLQTKYSFSKQAWFGAFEDEFLNTVSLKAHRVGFFAVMIICSTGIFGLFNLAPISFSEIFSGFLDISLIAYGTTVCVNLREQDE